MYKGCAQEINESEPGARPPPPGTRLREMSRKKFGVACTPSCSSPFQSFEGKVP